MKNVAGCTCSLYNMLSTWVFYETISHVSLKWFLYVRCLSTYISVGFYCILFCRLPIRPSEEQLAIMRKARMKERKMLFLLQEIIVHLIFTIVIVLVTYGHKDSRSVYLYRHVDELRSMTDQVCTLATSLQLFRLDSSISSKSSLIDPVLLQEKI